MGISNPLQFFHPRNLLTYVSVLAATWGIWEINQTQSLLGFAGAALCTAIIADMFDGKFAALFTGASNLQKEIGGHLDSLADFLAFGFYPAFGLMVFERSRLGNLEFLTVLIAIAYLFAVLHRLAFYNAVSSSSGSFVGLPAPVGALGIALAWIFFAGPMLLLVYSLMALLMVSSLKIARPGVWGLFFIVLLSLVVGILHVFH